MFFFDSIFHRRLAPIAAAALAAATLAFPSADDAQAATRGAKDGPAFSVRTIIGKLRVGEVDDLYRFLAAVPAAYHKRDGKAHRSALLIEGSPGTGLLATEWNTYLTGAGRRVDPVFLGPGGVVGTPIQVAAALSALKPANGAAILVTISGNPSKETFEATANAAVLASRLGVPLLYSTSFDLSKETATALQKASITSVELVDSGFTASPDLFARLKDLGVQVSARHRTREAVLGRLRSLWGDADAHVICLASDTAQLAPAAIAAAGREGVCLLAPAGLATLAREADEITRQAIRRSPLKLESPARLDAEEARAETEVASRFQSFLAAQGFGNEALLENVLTFAPAGLNGIPVTLERAIVGDPDHPELPGALCGRFPGTPEDNTAIINRALLYPALIFQNPRRNRVSMEMTAFEVQFPAVGSTPPFKGNDGKNHIVNELVGCHEGGYDDHGVYHTFLKGGYQVGFHNGRSAGGAGEDPINHESFFSFVKEVEDGSSFFYNSSHGSDSAFYPLDRDNGIAASVPFSDPHWPSSSGRVNQSGGGFGVSQTQSSWKSLNSLVAFWNSCLMARGDLNRQWLLRGAAGSVSSYTSISFPGGGYFCMVAIERMLRPGATLGEAVAAGLAATSEIFPSGTPGADASLRMVLFGDPMLEFVKPNWTVPAPRAR